MPFGTYHPSRSKMLSLKVRSTLTISRWVESKLEAGHVEDVRRLIESNQFLHTKIVAHITSGREDLSALCQAVIAFTRIRESLGLTPKTRLSSNWTRAASGELLGSPLLRETMLALKKTPSDKLTSLLESLNDLGIEELSPGLQTMQKELESLIKENEGSGPLRSQDDVRNESVRTTVVAQKVLLSRHKAALSEQDKAYSEIVAKLHEQLDTYFNDTLFDPSTLPLHEVLIYDLRSPHTEVFQPKPRLAIERALATPHDYLGCDCCGAIRAGEETRLGSTQPATAIVYQLYLESGAFVNVSDMWSAFKAILGTDEDDESQSMYVFDGNKPCSEC